MAALEQTPVPADQKPAQDPPPSIWSTLFTILAGLVVIVITDFPAVFAYDPRIRSFSRNVSVFLFLIMLVVPLLVFYIVPLARPHVAPPVMHEMHPVIIVATACGFVGSLAYCYAAWPVWGVLSVPIGMILAMAFVSIVSLIPGPSLMSRDKRM